MNVLDEFWYWRLLIIQRNLTYLSGTILFMYFSKAFDSLEENLIFKVLN
jgi:hypothetical protein